MGGNDVLVMPSIASERKQNCSVCLCLSVCLSLSLCLSLPLFLSMEGATERFMCNGPVGSRTCAMSEPP